MFVTNKEKKLGIKIENNKIVDINLSVITIFKLLGVTLDNKLNFSEHCSNINKIVNKNCTVKRPITSFLDRES